VHAGVSLSPILCERRHYDLAIKRHSTILVILYALAPSPEEGRHPPALAIRP
jgi:hypothetical protein